MGYDEVGQAQNTDSVGIRIGGEELAKEAGKELRLCRETPYDALEEFYESRTVPPVVPVAYKAVEEVALCNGIRPVLD